MKRTQFTFYESVLKSSELMEENELAPYFLAIIRYGLYGIEPDISTLPKGAAIGFLSHKPSLAASRKKAKSGKAGGESKRKGSKSKANGSKPKANASTAEANSKQSASEKENEKEEEIEKENEIEIEGENDKRSSAPAQPLSDSDFEKFWAAYPCQIGKENAHAMWQVKTVGASLADILAALDLWKASPQWKEDGGRYVPRAAKWLHEEHWKRPPAPAKEPIPKGASGVLGAAELEAIQRVLSEA